jgi:hypothetical protein
LFSTVLITAIIQLLVSTVGAYRLQLSLGQLEESGRYARDVLISHINQAGFQPRPWEESPALPAITAETINGNAAAGDQLGLQRWSDRNCYGSENPVKDSDGRAKFFLLQTRFQVSPANNLAMTCRFGPDASQLITQVNNYGLVENVESMQILFAEDRDGDNIADAWVLGQAWNQEGNIRAIKLALLLSTQQRVEPAGNEQITMLDELIDPPADSRLRRVSVLTAAIRGRLK